MPSIVTVKPIDYLHPALLPHSFCIHLLSSIRPEIGDSSNSDKQTRELVCACDTNGHLQLQVKLIESWRFYW